MTAQLTRTLHGGSSAQRNRRGGTARALAIGIGLLLAAGAAHATNQGITGKKLVLKSSGKLVLLSKDPSISVAGSNPVGGVDSTVTFDDGSGLIVFALPKFRWSSNASNTLFKYKNKSAPAGPSPVKVAKVKSGLLKLVANGIPFNVPNGPATLSVVLPLDGGTNTYCLSFTGTGDGNTFRVKDAGAAICPPTICGNNVKEGAEICDGSDDAACPSDCLGNCTCAAQCPASGGDQTVCWGMGVLSCGSCCEDDSACSAACNSAIGVFCTNAALNDSCAAAANSAGCAAECCP